MLTYRSGWGAPGLFQKVQLIDYGRFFCLTCTDIEKAEDIDNAENADTHRCRDRNDDGDCQNCGNHAEQCIADLNF